MQDAAFFDNMPEMSKRIPIWFHADKDNQVIGLVLPFLSLDQCRDCEVNEFCFLSKTSSRQPVPPALGNLNTHWSPWDEDLDESVHFHLAITKWELYKEVYNYVADDAIDLLDDGDVAADFRLQCFISIYHLAMPKIGPKIYFPKLISENFPELSSKIPKLIPKIIPKSVPESNFPKLGLKVIAKKCSARKLVNVSPKFVFLRKCSSNLIRKVKIQHRFFVTPGPGTALTLHGGEL